MKRLVIVLILALLPLQLLQAGDVVGGGTLSSKEVKLSQQIKSHLKKQHDLNQAYNEWLRTMTPEQQDIIFEKVFDHLIVPQISN